MYMRYHSAILPFLFSLFWGFFLLACSSLQVFNAIGIKDEADSSLPVIKTFRALPDVTSIGFEWKTPEDTTNVSGYIIFRENAKKQFEKRGFVNNAFSTHYYDDKLQPQTEYVYAIASVGKDSKISQLSAPLKVKTSFIDPVTFVYASQDYAQKIKIVWSPSPNPVVKSYIIERQEKDGKFVVIGSTANRMLVEFFDMNRENDSSHNYRVIAQSHDGARSVPSQVVVGKTRNTPSVVEGVRASHDKVRAIWIEWTPHPSKDIIGYNVWVSNMPNDGYRKIAFVPRESHIDKIESNGAIRYYKVSAVDKFKLESKLQEQGVGGQTLPPPPPPRLTKGAIEDDVALIGWDKDSSGRIISYVVYRRSQSGAVDKFSQIKGHSFSDKEIQSNVSYTYSVVGVDKYGIESHPSRQVTLQIQADKEPPQPTLIKRDMPSSPVAPSQTTSNQPTSTQTTSTTQKSATPAKK